MELSDRVWRKSFYSYSLIYKNKAFSFKTGSKFCQALIGLLGVVHTLDFWHSYHFKEEQPIPSGSGSGECADQSIYTEGMFRFFHTIGILKVWHIWVLLPSYMHDNSNLYFFCIATQSGERWRRTLRCCIKKRFYLIVLVTLHVTLSIPSSNFQFFFYFSGKLWQFSTFRNIRNFPISGRIFNETQKFC